MDESIDTLVSQFGCFVPMDLTAETDGSDLWPSPFGDGTAAHTDEQLFDDICAAIPSFTDEP